MACDKHCTISENENWGDCFLFSFNSFSFDRTVAVWEECVGEYGRDGVQSNWIKKTSHVDSRTSITDVKFAPKHLGLLLATCSADGIVSLNV